MSYSLGVTDLNGVKEYILCTKSEEGFSDLSGEVSFEAERMDSTTFYRCMVKRKLKQEHAGGVFYDWYLVDNVSQYTDRAAFLLEEALSQVDETAIALYEAQAEQETINAAQDEALIELYEMMEG